MIKTVTFDLGGVIITIDQGQAQKRFEEIGVKDAKVLLDPYTQTGFFGDLEEGLITPEEFVDKLSEIAGKKMSFEDCKYAWTGYCKEVPLRNLHLLEKLREEGYRLLLLSNTNPFMQDWANSPEFSPEGKPLSSYFDAVYLSYQMKAMKPSEQIFHKMLLKEQTLPEEILFVDDSPRNVAAASEMSIKTFCPKNGEDWTKEIYNFL